MVVPRHVLASFRGGLGDPLSPTETWSFGLRFGRDATGGAIATTPTQGMANAFHAAASALILNSGLSISSHVLFQEVRVYEIGPDGRSVSVPVISAGADAQGPDTTGQWPWQCSMVVTLRADGLGKGRRGRIFLPPQGHQIGIDGLLTTGQVSTGLAAIETFLEACANATDLITDDHLVIIGGTGVAGTIRRVTNFGVGRVIDTQRRRRRSLDESYTTSLITE